MLRIFLGLLLGGGGGLAASHLAVAELFNIDFWSLAQSSDKRLIAFAVIAGLPLLVILLRGWIGFLVSTLFIAGGSALAIKLYVEDNLPWEQVLTMTVVYALVSIAVYKLLVRRVIGS